MSQNGIFRNPHEPTLYNPLPGPIHPVRQAENAAQVRDTAPSSPDSQPNHKPFRVTNAWLRAQSLNASRHLVALRPFHPDEFGRTAAVPTEAHIQAVNQVIGRLRQDMSGVVNRLDNLLRAAAAERSSVRLAQALVLKERAHDHVRQLEQVWDFYFELFGQRQSQYGHWLLSCDRIALDCYQYVYLGLGIHKSIPSPPPFSYMRTGFSPATFRRGIPLRRLGKQLNPFPLIQLPYHRLVNAWTLGAILHEVSHNLQNDLGLEQVVPQTIYQRLREAGHSPAVARTWTRWNREIFADVSALLLGGPGVVPSLLDVIGRSPESTLTFVPNAPHPTPYLRAFISLELLGRMGFADEARRYRQLWNSLYPDPHQGTLPTALLMQADEAIYHVIDAICYQSYATLGNKTLAQVIRFEQKEQAMIEQAAERLAKGIDPGVVPERFLIGATRVALDRRLASPGVIVGHFFKELARR